MASRPMIRSLAVLLGLTLLASACGTMLDDDERRAAILLQSSGGGGGGAEVDDDLTDDDFDFEDDGDLNAGPDGEVAVDDGAGPAAGASGSGTGDVGDPSTGSSAAPGGGSADAGGESQAPGDQQGSGQEPQPASGPRTASDVGVTPDQIVIANVSDISGPIPGIFESARQATQAYAAYLNARGGIHGRQIQVLALDSRADASENRNMTLQACERAFAAVGSMAAFDMGGASAVDECGIPDLTSIPVTAQRQQAKNTFGAHPQNPNQLTLTPAQYIKDKHPEAVKRAALIYTDAPTTRLDGQKRRRGYEQIGYTFEMETAVSAVEANMAPFVLEMRRREISYVTGVMPYQQIVRLHEAMTQQGYRPEVTHWDSVVYDPGFLKLGGEHVEDVEFYINTNMFEEINQHEEMQRYVQWLRRVAPNAQPTYFGLYSWSATAMFEKVATAVGPELTREAFFAELRKLGEWDGNGLHVPHQPGQKSVSPCMINLRVENNRFVRSSPASGFMCRDQAKV